MIGILGGMGTQAGLDFCNKLAVLNRGKIDQEYPLFILYNKSNIPGRPESIGSQTKNLSNKSTNKKSKIKYERVLKSLLKGCKLLKQSKSKFIVIPCNTAHYWYDDLKKKIKLPIINMPKEVYNHTLKNCKKNSSVNSTVLCTQGMVERRQTTWHTSSLQAWLSAFCLTSDPKAPQFHSRDLKVFLRA